jgi:hypothetical protein
METAYHMTSPDRPQIHRPARLQLWVGEETWAWKPDTPGASLSDTGARFLLSLVSDRGRTIQLGGQISCDSLTPDVPVPDGLAEMLGRHSGAEVRRFHSFDFGRARDGRGISVVVDRHGADAVVRSVRAELPPGWVAWRGTSRFDPALEIEGVEVVVGPGTDARHILRLAHTATPTHHTEAVIAKLDDWDSRYGNDLFCAMDDSLGFLLHQPPDDRMPLAAEIYAFAPDVVDQSLGSTEALAQAITESGGVLLYWTAPG